jgi:uncharacterized LabA/DUF88 family protein
MKSVAILLDAGFVKFRLRKLLRTGKITAEQIYEFALACRASDEEILRIYYYDCPPFAEEIRDQRNRDLVLFTPNEKLIAHETALQNSLALKDLVAYRRGELSFSGWKMPRHAEIELQSDHNKKIEIALRSLKPDFTQKRVDMKIGLDVAWLASKRICDRIILVTADSDFIPAMKFARREGTQVVLVPMGTKYIKTVLKEHADIIRDVPFPPEASQPQEQ